MQGAWLCRAPPHPLPPPTTHILPRWRFCTEDASHKEREFMEKTPSSTAWEPRVPHLIKPDSIHMLVELQCCLRPSSTPPAHTVGLLVRCGVGSGSPARPSSLCILVLGASSPRQLVRAMSHPPHCSIMGPAIFPEQHLAVGPSAPCISQQGQHLYTYTLGTGSVRKKRQFRSEDRAGMGSPAGCGGGRGVWDSARLARLRELSAHLSRNRGLWSGR